MIKYLLRDDECCGHSDEINGPRCHDILNSLTNVIDAQWPDNFFILFLKLWSQILKFGQASLLKDQWAVISERWLIFIAVSCHVSRNAINVNGIVHRTWTHTDGRLEYITYTRSLQGVQHQIEIRVALDYGINAAESTICIQWGQ